MAAKKNRRNKMSAKTKRMLARRRQAALNRDDIAYLASGRRQERGTSRKKRKRASRGKQLHLNAPRKKDGAVIIILRSPSAYNRHQGSYKD